jgi:hypothetical protein
MQGILQEDVLLLLIIIRRGKYAIPDLVCRDWIRGGGREATSPSSSSSSFLV